MNWILEDKKEIFILKKILFGNIVQGIGKIYHEVLLLMKFLQTKPSVKYMHINF